MGTRRRRKDSKKDKEYARQAFEKERRRNLHAEPGPHDFVLVLEGLKPHFNVAKLFRSADAFGAKEVHLISIPQFDPRPGVGSFKWVPAHFHEDFESCYQMLKDDYQLYALDTEGAELLGRGEFPKKSAFILGHEERGISDAVKKKSDIKRIQIPQFGRVQSLNVSVAGSLVMYEYVRQHAADASD